MIAYKLVKQRRDGSIGPLFIGVTMRIPFGSWLKAEAIRKKGYAFRPGWHCTVKPEAPHLAERPDRVWVEVEVKDFEYFTRPASQGGTWILAQQIKLLRIVEKGKSS